jgi:hypothetical protein
MSGTHRTTRRTILGAGLGSIVALVAHALGRPDPTRGGDGGPVILATVNLAGKETVLSNDGNVPRTFVARNASSAAVPSAGAGTAVTGESSMGTGLLGHTDGLNGQAGVRGESGARTSYGVVGVNLGNETMGVLGAETAGVRGIVPNAAGFISVQAFALEEATALSVEGTARFSRSGKTSVPARRSFIDVVVPGGLSTSSLVLAVLALNRAGVHVQSTVPNPRTGMVRINLNKVASSTAATPVAWFVVN